MIFRGPSMLLHGGLRNCPISMIINRMLSLMIILISCRVLMIIQVMILLIHIVKRFVMPLVLLVDFLLQLLQLSQVFRFFVKKLDDIPN